MKKSIKLTLGLLGISAISAITVGSVISCSNDSSMVSTTSNNSSNSNNTNKSSSTNPNSSNDTSFIPYSELTKTVTKEPSFAAALANWTNKWNQLTSNKETYLKMITNDFNASLSDTTEFFNAHSNAKDNWLTNCYDRICSESYSNVQISLNKNNTFNISYDTTSYIGYIKNKIAYPQVIKITSKNNYTNLTFTPYLYKSLNSITWNINGPLNHGGSFYAGEFASGGTYTYCGKAIILSKVEYDNAPSQTLFNSKMTNGQNLVQSLNINFKENLQDKDNNTGAKLFPLMYSNMVISPIFSGSGYLLLISSYQNGINYGELSLPNNK